MKGLNVAYNTEQLLSCPVLQDRKLFGSNKMKSDSIKSSGRSWLEERTPSSDSSSCVSLETSSS